MLLKVPRKIPKFINRQFWAQKKVLWTKYSRYAQNNGRFRLSRSDYIYKSCLIQLFTLSVDRNWWVSLEKSILGLFHSRVLSTLWYVQTTICIGIDNSSCDRNKLNVMWCRLLALRGKTIFRHNGSEQDAVQYSVLEECIAPFILYWTWTWANQKKCIWYGGPSKK